MSGAILNMSMVPPIQATSRCGWSVLCAPTAASLAHPEVTLHGDFIPDALPTSSLGWSLPPVSPAHGICDEVTPTD